MAIEKKYLKLGLNSDIEDRLLPNDEYRYALNVRASKSDGSNEGAIENTKGNLLVNVTLPVGRNRIIGAYDDLDHNFVFYFMFNSFANHTIYKYDPVQNTVTTILQTAILKFTSESYINDARVVGDLLFFNDRVNQPRKINYVRAENNGYPNPFKEQYINAIVYPPSCPPETVFVNDPTVSVNNLRGALRQFRTQNVYMDNEVSAWSSISKTALPIDEALYRPYSYYPTELNNRIDVSFDLGDDTVTKVRIAVREGNTGDFVLIEEIDKSKIPATVIPTQTYTYKYYNDKVPTPLDNDGNTGMRLFDNTPLKADSQELIDGNRIAYGGITEFFDPVDVDVDITVNEDVSIAVPAPVITPTLPFSYAFRDFGIVPASDHWWSSSQDSDKHLRIINGITYRLIEAAPQEQRPNPASRLFQNNWANPTRTFETYFSAGSIHDRVVYMRNESSGLQIPVGGSALNEITIAAPAAAGIRYVLTTTARWYDVGTSDALVSESFKVQYLSQPGDDAFAVATGLIAGINALSPITRNKVELKFNNSYIGGYQEGIGSAVPVGSQSMKIWIEAYIPSAFTVNPPFVQGVSRAWLTALGQDTPALYSSSSSLVGYADWTTQNKKSLKAGANHSIGFVYYNEANQSGLTNVTNEKTFYVPHFTERAIPNGNIPIQTSLTVNINHLPPSWATHYQVVYSGNQTVEKLPTTEGYLGFVQFQLKNVSNSTITGAIECDISNIIDYNNQTPEDIDLGYSFTKGDRIRFITDAINPTNLTYNYLQSYSDVEVISFDDLTNKLVFKDPGFTPTDNQLVEIYTPKKKVDELVYKEIGECHKIINGYHQGDTSQTISTPATLILEDIGDVYLRYRTAPVSAQIESYAFSDYYKSDSNDEGRPNIVDETIKEIKRPSTVRFSNVYIPETNINGLSRFDDLDFEAYDQRYGSIQRMHSEDKDLTIFQNLKVGKIRIGQTTLYGNEGTNVATVKSENKVLSDIVYYKGEFGIGINPESFAVYGNRKYFADVARGSVLRLGGDGLTEISEYQMHNYFNDTFKQLIDGGGNYKVFGEFDVRFDEYVISIREDVPLIPLENVSIPHTITLTDSVITDAPRTSPRPSYGTGEAIDLGSSALIGTGTDATFSNSALTGTGTDAGLELVTSPSVGLVVGEGTGTDIVLPEAYNIIEEDGKLSDTISFSEYKKRWGTFYSYDPDYMVSNNIGFLSFKNGYLYIHNENALYNNFYGVQYSSIIETISNAEPSSIKFYNNIYTESTHPFSMTATNQFGQETSLIIDDFVDDEGVWKSALLRDVNTPNVDNPLFEGDEMRCHSMTVRLENSETELVKIFAIGIGLNLSQLTSK